MPSSDFEKKMREALNKQQEQRKVADKTKLHDAEIIQTVGSRNWDRVTDHLEKSISAINKGFNVIEYNGAGKKRGSP